jgi:hypothetical protein
MCYIRYHVYVRISVMHIEKHISLHHQNALNSSYYCLCVRLCCILICMRAILALRTEMHVPYTSVFMLCILIRKHVSISMSIDRHVTLHHPNALILSYNHLSVFMRVTYQYVCVYINMFSYRDTSLHTMQMHSFCFLLRSRFVYIVDVMTNIPVMRWASSRTLPYTIQMHWFWAITISVYLCVLYITMYVSISTRFFIQTYHCTPYKFIDFVSFWDQALRTCPTFRWWDEHLREDFYIFLLFVIIMWTKPFL